jgi:hypothetical protein
LFYNSNKHKRQSSLTGFSTFWRNSSFERTLAKSNFIAGSIFDRNFFSGLRLEVDGGRWSRDVEGDPEVGGGDGKLQGPDLVGSVAVGSNAVGADDDGRDFLQKTGFLYHKQLTDNYTLPK